jgi:hypothetical protein
MDFIGRGICRKAVKGQTSKKLRDLCYIGTEGKFEAVAPFRGTAPAKADETPAIPSFNRKVTARTIAFTIASTNHRLGPSTVA